MKHITTIGLALLLLAGKTLAATLVLGEADGFACPVKVSGYKEGEVKLNRGTGLKMVPLSEFSEAVQKKILHWHSDQMFKSSSGLRIKVEEIEREEGKFITRVRYIITLENRSEVMLSGIKLTSRVFLDQWREKTEDADSFVYTEFLFSADLPAGESRVFETVELLVRDGVVKKRTYDGSEFAGDKDVFVEDKLLGMSLVVEKTGMDQKPIVRTAKEGKPPSKRKAEKYIKKGVSAVRATGGRMPVLKR